MFEPQARVRRATQRRLTKILFAMAGLHCLSPFTGRAQAQMRKTDELRKTGKNGPVRG